MAVHNVQQILEAIPSIYRGPGGAIAIVKDGELIAQKTWGYANLDERIPITPQTIMPICSISKQMVCALLLDLENNPPSEVAVNGPFRDQMEKKIKDILPKSITEDGKLTVRHLCDMQSGLRDYWAVAMICGAKPDDRFTIEEDGRKLLSKYKNLHFEPGQEYSYSNVNFYVLGRSIEAITGKALPNLLEERIFRPRGMKSAKLIPDTAQQPGDCVGYEGNEEFGFLPSVNRIEWSGDAGITASLDDMIAYEIFFDKEWSAKGQYHKIAGSQSYKDGQKAPYSYGLSFIDIGDLHTVGHGGALRGWRMQRRYVPRDRLSVVVMFNSENIKAGKAVEYIIRKALNLPEPPTSKVEPSSDWIGNFLDKETQLSLTVSEGPEGHVAVRYTRDVENIRLINASRAENDENRATIDGDVLTIHRIDENRHLVAQRIPSEIVTDGSFLQGHYSCGEMETTFFCQGRDNMLYGSFDGCLGRGPANLMKRLGENVWSWACPRGLDHTPPGDWTIVFHRNTSGVITGCTIGCWLARKLEFIKV